MTTVAWDGKYIAADTLSVDGWGLKDVCDHKILHGSDYVLGIAGGQGQILRWWAEAKEKSASELLIEGYSKYEEEKNDPNIMLICELGSYKLSEGFFIKIGRNFHAIGSGRDFAIAAMHLGMTAVEAVGLAKQLDNATGGEVISIELKWRK